MTMNHERANHERASLGAALRDAADSFSVPQPEQMHERAVRRGRQIKRRRATGASLSAAVAVGAVAALTVGLLGVGAPTQPSTVLGVGGGRPSPTPSVKPVPPIYPGTAKYMVDQLRPLLPPGAQLAITPTSSSGGGYPLTGEGYGINSSGGTWDADASAFITYAGQRYTIVVDVDRAYTSPTCTSPRPPGPCTAKPLGHGTLLSSETQEGGTSWRYVWSLADGASVQLQVNEAPSGNGPNPYTEQQIESLLTAPGWTSVLNKLPQVVKCGVQPLHGMNSALGWVCPDGKTYPGVADIYVAYS